MAEQWDEQAVARSREAHRAMWEQQTAQSVARYVVAADALPTRDSASLNHYYASILAKAYLKLLDEGT